MARDLTDLTPDEVMERWKVFHRSILDLGKAAAEALTPAFRQAIDAIHAFIIQLQRAQLGTSLARHWWIPERLACWLSDKWPERWLPELRFEHKKSAVEQFEALYQALVNLWEAIAEAMSLPKIAGTLESWLGRVHLCFSRCMTLDEFEQQYAEHSGVTVEWLHAHGRHGTPCDCAEPDCKGWQMKHAEPEMKKKVDEK